mgnify:CR=1 FL=1
MFGPIVYHEGSGMANDVARQMHNLVTYGPWDLDIAHAMAGYGYDEVKWAEGEVALAELVSGDRLAESHLAAATEWYKEAVATAQCALVARPSLLDKLGVAGVCLE